MDRSFYFESAAVVCDPVYRSRIYSSREDCEQDAKEYAHENNTSVLLIEARGLRGYVYAMVP